MIAEAGHYALVLALGLALVQSTVPILGARWHDPALMNVARSTALAQLLFVASSFAALVTLHVTSDFSVINVFENSHSLKPLIYKITGVWGNHEGSMLLWVSIMELFGGASTPVGQRQPCCDAWREPAVLRLGIDDGIAQTCFHFHSNRKRHFGPLGSNSGCRWKIVCFTHRQHFVHSTNPVVVPPTIGHRTGACRVRC